MERKNTIKTKTGVMRKGRMTGRQKNRRRRYEGREGEVRRRETLTQVYAVGVTAGGCRLLYRKVFSD